MVRVATGVLLVAGSLGVWAAEPAPAEPHSDGLRAGWFLDLGFAKGGDALGISRVDGPGSIGSAHLRSAGDGWSFSAGYRWRFGDHWGVQTSLGHKRDRLQQAEHQLHFRRMVSELLISRGLGDWWLSLGLSRESTDDFCSVCAHFPAEQTANAQAPLLLKNPVMPAIRKDANGVLIQADYPLSPHWILGLRATRMDYDASAHFVYRCGGQICQRRLQETLRGDHLALHLGWTF